MFCQGRSGLTGDASGEEAKEPLAGDSLCSQVSYYCECGWGVCVSGEECGGEECGWRRLSDVGGVRV